MDERGRDDVEITKTGIVRKRNENGYIIHPDREDTGEADRYFGLVLIISGVVAFAFIGVRVWPATAMFLLLGFGLIMSGIKKRARVGTYRSKSRWP